MSLTEPDRSLATVLDPSRCVVLPGAYDALSAKLVQEEGFEAVYVGSYATAAAQYGLPDVGALTLDEMVGHARAVAGAVTLPVIADAEGGFFDPAHQHSGNDRNRNKRDQVENAGYRDTGTQKTVSVIFIPRHSEARRARPARHRT